MLQPRKPLDLSSAQEILSTERPPLNLSEAQDILKKKEPSQLDWEEKPSDSSTQPTFIQSLLDTGKPTKLSVSGTSNGAPKTPKSVSDDSIRNDGTQKQTGYFGTLKMQDGSGKDATEMSIGVEIEGKETEKPTLVTKLSESEKNYLLKGGSPNDKKNPIAQSIIRKAVDFAYSRKKEGKPYFADNKEYVSSVGVVKTPKPPKEEVSGFGEGLLNRLDTGIARISKSIYDAPKMLLDAIYVPQNYLAEKLNIPSLRVDPETYAYENIPSKNMDKIMSKNNTKIASYKKAIGGDVMSSFDKGDYVNTLKHAALDSMESAPLIATTLATGGSSLLANSIMIGSSASTQYAELSKENPEMETATKLANSAVNGALEVVVGKYMEGITGNVWKTLLKDKGADVATSIATNSFKKSLEKVIGDSPIVGVAGEYAEERITDAFQQLNNISTGAATEFDWNQNKGAGLSSLGFGLPNAAALYGTKAYISNKTKKQVSNTSKQIVKLQNELQNPDLSEENKKIISESITEIYDKNKKLLGDELGKLSIIPESEQKELFDLDKNIDKAKSDAIDIKYDVNISDENKVLLLKKLEDSFKESSDRKDEILGNVYNNQFKKLDVEEQNTLKEEANKALQKEFNPDGTREYKPTEDEVVKKAISIKNEEALKAKEDVKVEEVEPIKQDAQKEVVESKPIAETPKDYKVYFDQDVNEMTVQENNGEFLIGNYAPASEGNNPSMKPVTDLEGNPLTFKTKEEAQAKLDEVQAKPTEVTEVKSIDEQKALETPIAEVITPIAETTEAKVETPTAPESKIIEYNKQEYYKNEEGNWVNNKTGNEIKGIGVSGKGKALINALNIKEKNPTKKYKLTERGQAFNVEYKNGKLEVTKSDGSKVSKPYELAILRKHADNYDFTQGKRAVNKPDFEEKDWDNEVIRKSNNASEIAEAVYYASFDDITNLTFEEKADLKEQIIAENIGKVTKESFLKADDKSNVTGNEKHFRKWFSDKGQTIDELLVDSITEDKGVTIKDIVDFIKKYKSVDEFNKQFKDDLSPEQLSKINKIMALKDKFTELTGLPATPEFLSKAVKQAARKFTGHDTLDQLSDAQLEAKYNELKQFEEQQYGKQAEKVIEPTKRVDEVKDTKDTGEVQEGVEKVEPVLSKTDEAFRDKIRDIPNSGLVGKYLSGETIERVEGETPRNKQDIEVLNLVEAGNHGKETIEMAKEKYGDKYIEKTLEFLESTNLKSHEKAIVYISLENELFDAVKAEPDNLGLKKLQDLVRAKSQALGREGSLTINAGRLRAIMKDGFDVSQVTDKFLSDAELRDKSNVEKAIQSNAEEIQKEYEEQESNILEGENERPIYTQKDFDAELQKAKDELGKNYDISVFENLKRQARKDKLSDIKEDLKLAKEKVLEDIRKVVRESRSEMSVNPISKPIEFTALVAKLAKIYIQEGALSLEEVANNIYNDLKDMSKDISKESIINALKSKPKRVMSEATKRKIYISLLNKSIESLDTQIQAKKRNIVTNTDKYKRDAEIKELRNKRDGKKEELAKIDPSYAESRKLETDLKLAQNSLEEYQRRIDENDLTPREKEPKIVAEKLKKLRQLRDTKKKEYLAKKKKFEDSLKEPAILPTKEELENKKYLSEVDSKIKSLNKRIEDLKENKQKDTYGKSTVWNEKISELENELKDLRESKKKYLSEDEISELKINAKLKERQKVLEDLIENKEKDVLGKSSYWSAEISKVNAEIKKLRESKKEYLSEEESAQQRIDKKLIQREKVLADLIEGKKKDVTGKKSDWSSEISRVNAEIQRLRDLKKQKGSKELSNKEVVNNALIEAGFGKEITVKTKAGKVKRTVLDWRKLAGEEGSIDKIKENVEKIIGEEAAKDLEAEYNNLRARIIEKSLNELENRNTPRSPVSIKTSAKKLAELYNYGMFEKDPDSYDNLLNTALGMSKLNQENFIEAKKLAGKLSELFSQKDSKGNQISQENLKHAERVINRQIENLLSKIAWSDSNGVYKATIVAKEYIGLAQRNALVSAGQAVENTTSGYISRIFKKIGFAFDNVDTKSLRQSRNALEKMTFKDITLNGGLEFGDVTSPFITKSKTQDLIVNASDSQIYHALASTALGKPFLESADSMHKSALAQGYFHYNLIKILRKKGYSKDEAKNYVSEKLTGQSFEDALVTSKQIIDKINEGSDKKIIPDTKESIYRFANDLVNEALIQGNKITLKELEASLKSAETVAGFELGHEPNNVFSKPLNLLNSWVQVKVDRAVKQKEWNNAAALTSASIISQNVLNPYVGGGTNWMFLAAQKTGIPTASTFYWNIRARGSKLDLSSESGIKNLEQTLKYQLLAKNANIRMFVGATVSLSAFALFKSTGADDDLYQWLKKNEWANKYFKKIAPPALQFMIAQKNKELGNFLANQMNIKIDAFDEGKKIKRAIDNAASGKTKKALGGVGQLVGSRLNTPIIPWRVVKDARDVYRGLNGLEPVKSDYKTSGFWNGYFQGGMIEQIGLRPEKDKVKVTPKTQEEMEKSMREAMKKVSEQMKKERRQ